MRQYMLPSFYNGESTLTLDKKDSQYFIKVLRLKIDDKIIARDINGKLFQLTLIAYDKNSCTLSSSPLNNLKEGETTDSLPEYEGPYPKLHLFQASCKGKKNEGIIRMATEIGVKSITLVQSRYCISKKENSNTQRYENIIKEAIQQSGSPITTTFNGVVDIKTLMDSWKKPLVFFHQSKLEKQKSLNEIISQLSLDDDIGVLIGPEGGFSDEECSLLMEKGFEPVLLKTNILRAETAAICALSAIHTLFMEK